MCARVRICLTTCTRALAYVHYARVPVLASPVLFEYVGMCAGKSRHTNFGSVYAETYGSSIMHNLIYDSPVFSLGIFVFPSCRINQIGTSVATRATFFINTLREKKIRVYSNTIVLDLSKTFLSCFPHGKMLGVPPFHPTCSNMKFFFSKIQALNTIASTHLLPQFFATQDTNLVLA